MELTKGGKMPEKIPDDIDPGLLEIEIARLETRIGKNESFVAGLRRHADSLIPVEEEFGPNNMLETEGLENKPISTVIEELTREIEYWTAIVLKDRERLQKLQSEREN